ncbi:glycosyl hydrolase [Pectobacterium sp. CFBP8739]|uniref:glycosyl hydrolase n=1 Tax=Pectobacterium sp. CFBP8739 TaxID=2748908 RepID=UPI0015DD6CF2|nr:glycosyl hydrolase [Pectobacterium sp. CFBP8739]MBA0167786.1 cellulase family glycosylhydrolase [Pectobacterium sp. CFBP8739]
MNLGVVAMLNRLLRSKSIILGSTLCAAMLPHTLWADMENIWHAKGLDQYVVESNKDAWIEIVQSPCEDNLSYSISDIMGREVDSGSVASTNCTSKVKLNLPNGYYHLNIKGVARGIYAHQQKKIPSFFGMDVALSYIVKDDSLRGQYISLLSQIGINVVRDRLMWGDLSPNNKIWDGIYYIDKLRRKYQQANIKVLDVVQVPVLEHLVFPDSDKIMGDFPKITHKWKDTWIGIEPKNEPNNLKGQRLSAEDMVEYVERYLSYSREMHTAVGNDVLVVNGAFAGGLNANAAFSEAISSRKDFFESKGDFSFHSYETAENLTKILTQYKSWLKSKGFSGNVWITESGRNAYSDDLTTVNQQNMDVAVQIAAKAIVGYSAGVKHYFPFVLPFYTEKDPRGRTRYFGLTSKDGSPNLSLAAYIQAGKILAGSPQSDVKFLAFDHGFKALIPSDENIAIAVYNNSNEKKAFPTGAMYAEGVDGRRIEKGQGDFLPDEKLVYFYFSKEESTAASHFFAERM